MDFFVNLEIVTRYLRGDRAGITFMQFLSALLACGKAIADNLGTRTQTEGQTDSLPVTESLQAIDDAELADQIEHEVPASLHAPTPVTGRQPDVQTALDPAIFTALAPLIFEVLRRFFGR